MLKINFEKDKIVELINTGEFFVTDLSKEVMRKFYMNNYSKVKQNIIDEELVGYAYENLCAIEKLIPDVKQLRKRM